MGDKGVYAKSGGKIRPIVAKGDPPVPQNEKVLTRFSQVGAPLCRIRLSVHKQTLPIGTDHLHGRSRIYNVD